MLLIGLLGSPAASQAASSPGEISEAEIIDFAKRTWGLGELTDDVIRLALDRPYRDFPFRDHIKILIVGLEFQQLYDEGRYKEAGTVLAQYAATRVVKEGLQNVGLSGVATVAGLAAWPLQFSFDVITDALNDDAHELQLRYYFAARPYNSYAEIVGAREFDLLDADTSVGLLTKTSAGWLFLRTGYHIPANAGVTGLTPAEFFEEAELHWQCRMAREQFDNDNITIREAFRREGEPDGPVFTTDLADQTIAEGQSTTFAVVATGVEPLSYAWYQNGSLVTPAIGPTFLTSAAGSYQVTVRDANNRAAQSRIVVLNVNPASATPVIDAPDAGATVSRTTAVRASATSAARVEFWTDGERRFTDSTSPFQWSWNTALDENGSHEVVVKSYGVGGFLGASAARTLTVSNAPAPTCGDSFEPNERSVYASELPFATPTSAFICTAADVDWFSVNVTNGGVLAFNLSVPPGNDYDLELFGPDSRYVLGSYGDTGQPEAIVHRAAIAGVYHVRVYGYPVGHGSHNPGTNYMLTATFTNGDITIDTPPQDQTVVVGASALFSVQARGTAPLTYQWQRNEADIPYATGPTYATLPVTLADDGAQFRVRLTNLFGAVTSAPVTLHVTGANLITWVGGALGGWNNPTNWNPMTVPGAGDSVLIANGGSISVPPDAAFAVLTLSNGTLSGTFTVNGTMNWTGGTLGGYVTIAPGAVLNVSGSASKTFGFSHTLNNEGTINWTGTGPLAMQSCCATPAPSSMRNLANGVFSIATDAWIPRGDAVLSVSNWGTFRKVSGTGTNFLEAVAFYNYGAVEVQSGIVQFNGGGHLGGTFDAAPGASVEFSGGNFSLGSVVVSGSGTRRMVGGFLALNGLADFQNFELEGGTITGVGTISGVLNCSGGEVVGDVTVEGDLNLVSGSLRSNVTVNGTMNWTGGMLGSGALTIAPTGVLNISGSAAKNFLGSMTLSNAGTVSWTGTGDLYPSGGDVAIQNLASGTFNVATDAGIHRGVLNFSFTNWGTFRKVGGTGTNFLEDVAFYNFGTVEILRGALEFSSAYTQTGAGALEVALGGPPNCGLPNADCGFGRIVVNGLASLDGALRVSLVNGFQPAGGDRFAVVTYGARSGLFSSFTGPALPAGLTLDTNYTATALELVTSDIRPRLSSVQHLPNGQFQFTLTNLDGQTYEVQASTNLLFWLPLTNFSGPGVFQFNDPEAMMFPQRYYRAVAP